MMRSETRKREEGGPEALPEGKTNDALWLARRDVRSSWASFPAEFVAGLVLGLLGAAQYRNALAGSSETLGQVVLDLFLLSIVAVLGFNLLFNKDYFKEMSDESFNGRLSFLRGLPVSAKSIVTARVFSMLLTIVCAVPVFFLAPYLVYAELRALIGFGDYLWYLGIWLGYALAAVGAFALSNFGFNWKTSEQWPRIAVAVLGSYGAVVLVSNLALEDGLALSLIELARTGGGPLAAAASTIVGFAALVACVFEASKRLSRRDIG